MRGHLRHHISILAGLSAGIALLVGLTAAIVDIPWTLTSRANVTDLNGQLDQAVIQRLADKVNGLLADEVATRFEMVAEIEGGLINIDDEAKRRAWFLSMIAHRRSLSSIEFGWPDDRSFRVRRTDDGGVVTDALIPNADDSVVTRRTVRYKGSGADGYLPVSEQSGPTDERASQQFWYLSALDADQPEWSNIYRLPDGRSFGVATTQAIWYQGQPQGVLALAISLDRLSAFVDDISVTPGSSVLLTNSAGQLVAAQTRMKGSGQEEPIGQSPPTLDEVKRKPVQILAGAIAARHLDLQTLRDVTQVDYSDAASGAGYFVTLAPLPEMSLIVGVVIPEADVLGEIDRNNRLLLATIAAFIVIAVGFGILAARRWFGRPLAEIVTDLRHLEAFEFDKVRSSSSRISEIEEVSLATARMGASLASFRKYIPTELVRTLFAQGIEAELGGEQRELTILFMDLAGFTAISERLGEGVVEFLGDYLSEMSAIIQRHGGTIDKYIGDAIMAFWGAPVPNDQHALLACQAALACQARLAELRAERRDQPLPAFHARIGINTGTVLVGNVGSRDRLNYTVIGDPVNVASRLEALNKVYGTSIIIGEATRARVGDAFLLRPLDRVAVYGKRDGIEMFELLAPSEGPAPAWIEAYRQARDALVERSWARSIELFGRVVALRSGDPVSTLLIKRVEAYINAPPPEDWDGLVVMDSK